jgi:hypothetical protein
MASFSVGDHPEWAGLALRWRDGRLMTVQLDHPDHARIEMEQQFHSSHLFPYATDRYMRFSVEGLILPWQAQWRDNPSKPAGILDYRKAIEE